MAASNESLQTPQRDSILRVPATEERAHFFWHVDNRRDGEAMQDENRCARYTQATAYRWIANQKRFGNGKRVRKRKAAEKGVNVAVMQCSKRSCVLFCCVVLFVLCSQRGSSRVCLHDVSLMYTCVESAHELEVRALGQYTLHT
jgi:hypothetical protein